MPPKTVNSSFKQQPDYQISHSSTQNSVLEGGQIQENSLSNAINYQPYLAYGAPPGMQQQQQQATLVSQHQQQSFGASPQQLNAQLNNSEFSPSTTNSFDYFGNTQRNQPQGRYYQPNSYQSTAPEGKF